MAPMTRRSPPPSYRDAVCCRTCRHVGESILNGAFTCSRHRCPVMGHSICDDHPLLNT
nr:hypothetical protein [Methanoculleus marisnigri]